MDRSILVQLFDQILEGWDIPTPKGMLRIKQETASIKAESAPYSLLTNLAHAVLWQDFWLQKLQGGRKSSSMIEWKNDFREPDPKEFHDLRQRFLQGLQQARELSASESFDHKAESDAVAVQALLQIAIHATYHCGQMNLLKRISH